MVVFFFTVALYLAQLRYVRMHLISDYTNFEIPNVTKNVIVSLTSIPSRVNKIGATLCSLLDQKLPVKIRLYIPGKANCEPYMPYRLNSRIINCPRLEIHTVEKDYGPALKFLPALEQAQRDKNLSVIIVDDDIIYPYEFIEKLYLASLQDTNSVHCTRGWKHSTGLQWEKTKTLFSHTLSMPTRVGIITGCGGYILSPTVIRKLDLNALFDYSKAPAAAKLMDDIWISGHLSAINVHKYVTPYIPRIRENMSTLFTPKHLNKQRKERNNEVILFFENQWDIDELELSHFS
jgi:hypothetical protein